MKLRSGFVSNSSSSSFVILIEKDEHEKVLREVHPYIRAVIEAIAETNTLYNMPIVTVSTYNDQSGYNNLDDLDIDYNGGIPEGQWEEEMTPHEALEEYQAALDKRKCCNITMDW